MEPKTLICFSCKHLRPLSGGCDAFPNGIPDVILQTNKHAKPLKDQDNDFVFKAGLSKESRQMSED